MFQSRITGKIKILNRVRKPINYKKAIEPLLRDHGKKKIPIEDVNRAIYETMGEAKSLSGKLVRYLESLQGDLKNKDAIDFTKANEIKQHIMKTFGAFKNEHYVGHTPDDAIAARSIGFKLIDTINENVPEVVPINNDYKNASILMDDMNQIIGQKSRSGIFKKAQAGISTSMSKGKEALAVVIDNFTAAYPQASDVVNDFRNFIAAKAIQGGSQPGLSAIATNRGLYGRASGGLQFLKDQPFERGIDLLTAIKSKKPISSPSELSSLAAVAGSRRKEK